jgi:ATP-dependent Clp protease ATP-binding subunit ClpA
MGISNSGALTTPRLREQRFTEEAVRLLKHAVDRGLARGHCGVLPPALVLWSLLRWEIHSGTAVLLGCLSDPGRFEQDLDLTLRGLVSPGAGDLDCSSLAELARAASAEAALLGRDYVATEHLVLAMLRLEDRPLSELFHRHAVSYDRYKEILATF